MRHEWAPLCEARLPLRGLAEDAVWNQYIRPHLSDLPANVRDICAFGFSEMVNNAIDHSEGTELFIRLIRSPKRVDMWVQDDGMGIFTKIQHSLGLADPRHALLELGKGRFTTDAMNHSGQGVFFTSKAFDEFVLLGGAIGLVCRHSQDPWAFDEPQPRQGTAVKMTISTTAMQKMKEIYDRFVTGEDYGFDRTHVPLKLATYGDEVLVSRSQAKRVLLRFDRFREILLDFAGVESIGQAFADEIFRVFRRAHPDVRLIHAHAGPDVLNMILRAEGEAGRDAATESDGRATR